MKKIRWIFVVLIVVILLGSAYRIVEQRNRAFFAQDQSVSSSMPMH
jgi:lipopolysaccharide export system protein LptC